MRKNNNKCIDISSDKQAKSQMKKTSTWLKKRKLKRETESFLIPAQNNVTRTNYVRTRIHKTQQNSRCRLCGDRDETINHIISGKLARREYKTRHD